MLQYRGVEEKGAQQIFERDARVSPPFFLQKRQWIAMSCHA